MTIRIEIKSTDLRDRQITAKSGKAYTFKEQTAWAHTCDQHGNQNPYPEKVTVTLPRGQEEPYPVGDYTLHPGSFYVGSFNSLEMSPRLAPVKARG